MVDLSSELYGRIRQDALPTEIALCNRQYTIRDIKPVYDPTPKPFTVGTLSGVVDYLKANVDAINLPSLICHVEDPCTVTVLSSLHGDFKQRSEYIRAEFKRDSFPFGKFLSSDRFNVMVQACFLDNTMSTEFGEIKGTDKGLVLKYSGNVQSSTIVGVSDDGVSQGATLRVSVAKNENVVLPNPVTLRPYRTFNEVEQPASTFIFRAQNGPEFALFEADNGAWESEAMKNIKAFLEESVPGLHVIA